MNTNPNQITSLTRQEILGDMFYTGSLGYFAQLITLSQLAGLSSNAQYQMASGYGTFGYEPKVDYLFGYPIAVQAGGVVLDVLANVVTANNAGDKEKDKNFMIQTGVLLSTLEHATPEQMFNDPANPTEAISAVKAIQMATAQGQKIYQITKNNIDNVMPLLNLAEGTKAEIKAAVAAGLEVTTHTDQLTVSGYTGEGYIIIDPETGSGGYRIGGGQNGGWKAILAISAYFWLTFAAFAIATISLVVLAGFAPLLALVLAAYEVFQFLSWVDGIKSADSRDDYYRANLGALLTALLGFMAPVAATAGAGAQGFLVFGSIFGTMLTNPFGLFQ